MQLLKEMSHKDLHPTVVFTCMLIETKIIIDRRMYTPGCTPVFLNFHEGCKLISIKLLIER